MDSNESISIVRRFNEALNAADVNTMMSLLTEDTVFENTDPPPDGTRFEGKAQVRQFWKQFFRGSSAAHIDVEEIFAFEDRCVMRWTYQWTDPHGTASPTEIFGGHIRGVDVYRLRDGLIAEKLSYVKG
jgi:steroid delta-isomerase-like uncharacterized protein